LVADHIEVKPCFEISSAAVCAQAWPHLSVSCRWRLAAVPTTRHLALGSGKDAVIYVVDRDNMGKFSSTQNNIYQQIFGQLAGAEFAKPSYFNGTVYYGAVSDSIQAFPIASGKLATTRSSMTSIQFPYPGATPVISANGSNNGIVWTVENGTTAVLHATTRRISQMNSTTRTRHQEIETSSPETSSSLP
jgi:hypothetical protein